MNVQWLGFLIYERGNAPWSAVTRYRLVSRNLFRGILHNGMNSVIKGGNQLPQSMCEFRNSQKKILRISDWMS